MLKDKKHFLADHIADVLKVAPSNFDPEDEALNNTTPNILDTVVEELESGDEELLSKFRKQNIDLLEDVDVRYSGKKSSRKRLRDSDLDSDTYLSEDSESESKGDEDTDDDSIKDADEEQESGDLSESDGNEDVDKESVEDSDKECNDVEEGTSKNVKSFTHMSETAPLSQLKKGLCVRNQMNMWENLLEIRIQLQKCLLAGNKMPQKDYFKHLQKEGGSEFSNKVNETKRIISSVLDKLLILQKLVLKKLPETTKLDKSDDKNETKEKDEGSDEDIASDTEEEQESDSQTEEEIKIPSKKIKLHDYEKKIGDRHIKYKKYRNSVIEKWNTKTRVALVKNNANSYSVLNQIEHSLNNRPKLIKRTQLKKSNYEILGHESKGDTEDSHEAISTEEFNSEIFDDVDFYHQLLRELIEVKSADITDPVQLGRQWIQLQNMRSKMKRKVDTRATKGRKIRYAVHTKLVNFMAPIEEHGWTDEAKNELFGSLFGKSQTASV